MLYFCQEYREEVEMLLSNIKHRHGYKKQDLERDIVDARYALVESDWTPSSLVASGSSAYLVNICLLYSKRYFPAENF